MRRERGMKIDPNVRRKMGSGLGREGEVQERREVRVQRGKDLD